MCDTEKEDKICKSKKYVSMWTKSDRLELLWYIKQREYPHTGLDQGMANKSYHMQQQESYKRLLD